MNNVLPATNSNTVRSKSNNYAAWICVVMGILLCLRAVNSVFLWPALLLGLMTVFVAKFECVIVLFFFMIPMGTIFKISADAMSFFTILVILFVLRNVLTKKIDIYLFLACVLLVAYMLLFSGTGQLTTIISIVCGIFLLYYTMCENVSLSKIVTAFSFGIIIASVLSLMREQLPVVNEIILISEMRLADGEHVTRFSGLYGNPNYFTFEINIVLATLSIFLVSKRKTFLYFLLFATLSVIGCLSVSKSFLLTWAITIVMVFIFSLHYKSKNAIKIFIILFISAIAVWIFAYDSINLYLYRFLEEGDNTISSVTTGRTDLWLAYLKAFFTDIKIFLFGQGIGGELINDRGAHNTYIELIYYLGIVGTLIYLFAVIKSIKNGIIKRISLLYAFPLMIMLFRLFAINMLTSDNLFFYLIVAGVSLHESKTNIRE